jgi:hypothetical protein
MLLPISFVIENIAKNYLLHETAHCVAFSLAEKLANKYSSSSEENWVMQLLISEAYANIVERLAAGLVADTHHGIFFSINSFVNCYTRQSRTLRGLMRRVTLSTVLRVGMYYCLYINVCAGEPEPGAGSRLVSVIPEADSGREDVAMLFDDLRECIGLDKKFLNTTSPIFFDYVNYGRAFEDVRQRYSFASLLTDELANTIDALTDLTMRRIHAVSRDSNARAGVLLDIDSLEDPGNVVLAL